MNTTEDLSFRQDERPEDRSLVIVDDDRAFLQRLVRAMETRGFEVRGGHSVAEGIELQSDHMRADVLDLDTAQQSIFLKNWFLAAYKDEMEKEELAMLLGTLKILQEWDIIKPKPEK